jgi:hypothetical protein
MTPPDIQNLEDVQRLEQTAQADPRAPHETNDTCQPFVIRNSLRTQAHPITLLERPTLTAQAKDTQDIERQRQIRREMVHLL